MERRKFSREFKLEAVKLVRERGVKVAQAARDLDVHATVLRSWVREFAGDQAQASQDKNGGASWLEPRDYDQDEFRDAWDRIGMAPLPEVVS